MKLHKNYMSNFINLPRIRVCGSLLLLTFPALYPAFQPVSAHFLASILRYGACS